MPDSAISELNLLTSPSGRDLLLIVDVPVSNSATKTNKNIDLVTFFGNVPANTSISGSLTVSANSTFDCANTVFENQFVSGQVESDSVKVETLIISNTLTPGSSTGTGIQTGTVFFDSNYLYIKVANTVVKRVSLSSF